MLVKLTEEASSVPRDTLLHMIPLEVQYACRFWAVHTASSSVDNSDENFMGKLDTFSSTMLLRWVTSMCILNAVSDAIAATRSVQQWMVNLASLVSNSSADSLVGQFRAMELLEGTILRHRTDDSYKLRPHISASSSGLLFSFAIPAK